MGEGRRLGRGVERGVERGDETREVVALLRLQAAYADVVSRRAWEELSTVLAADVDIEIDTVTSPPQHYRSAQEFIDFVGNAVARFDHFQFVILNSLVDIEDSRASANGRIFMCEIRHVADPDEWSTAYGLYQDRYRLVDGTWWITERRYRSLARTGSNAGVFGLPPGLAPFRR